MRILLADDEQFILDLMEMVLKSAGHTVRAVLNGELALKALESEGFDLVITDFSMPKMDGLVLTKEIKARQPALTVILLTGYGEGDSLPPNVDYVISKPLRTEALMEIVARLDSKPSS